MENKIELKLTLTGSALEKFMFMKEALEVSSDEQLLQKCFGVVFHILKNPDKINFEIRKGDFIPKNSSMSTFGTKKSKRNTKLGTKE